MNLERCGPLELILRKLRNPLEEIVCNSHRTHGVGTRRSRAHLVELFERRHDRTLRVLDHGEIRRKGGSRGAAAGLAVSEGFSFEHPVSSAPADAARTARPHSLRLRAAGVSGLLGTVRRFRMPLCWQVPHVLAGAPITFSKGPIAFLLPGQGGADNSCRHGSGRSPPCTQKCQTSPSAGELSFLSVMP